MDHAFPVSVHLNSPFAPPPLMICLLQLLAQGSRDHEQCIHPASAHTSVQSSIFVRVRVFIQNATKTRKCNKKTPLLKHFSETLECCLKRTSMKNNIKRLVVAVFFKEDHCFAVGVSSCQFCNWVVFPPLLSPNVNLPTCPLFHLTYFFSSFSPCSSFLLIPASLSSLSISF